MTDDKSDSIIRIKTVLALTGLSRSTLYRKISEGKFPRQIKISERCAGWRTSAVTERLKNPIFFHVDDHPAE